MKAMRASIEQQTKTVRAQQAAGEISKLELARAQMELADNARAEIETRTQVERALSALEEAIQRPLEWSESTWRTAPRSTLQQ